MDDINGLLNFARFFFGTLIIMGIGMAVGIIITVITYEKEKKESYKYKYVESKKPIEKII